MVLSRRARIAIASTVATVATCLLAARHLRGTAGALRPVDAVPRDAFLVATVNLAELRRSPIYDVLLGNESPTGLKKAELLSTRALGIAKLEEACGFDPLMRVDDLAVAVPEEGDRGELGVSARVNLTPEELSRCASTLAGQHGAAKPETRSISGFDVVEAAGDEAARPRLGYGHGLLVVGRGAWFDAMLAAADGKAEGVKDAAGHATLRAALTSGEGWHTPTVLVTALLPRSLRDRIKREMGGAIDAPGGVIMAGVLGVSSVGLALRANDQTVDAAVELVCDAGDACASVEKLIGKKRLEWSKELMLRMVGLGPLLDSIDVKRTGPRVRVTASAGANSLASTLDRVLRYRARPGGREETPAAAPGLPRRPDEAIPAAGGPARTEAPRPSR